MLDKKLTAELNIQLNFELESAHIYLAMAAYMDSKSLDGFSQWMKVQAQEEIEHAMRIYDYINNRGEVAILDALPKPRCEFNSVLEVFQEALAHECKLSEKLNELAGVALSVKDNTTYTFLEWFLTEQVEEVSSVQTICDKLELIGDNGYGLLMISNELGARQPGEEG